MTDSFLTQRFANSHPAWTKVRRDPSSVGQRFFSPIAGLIANEYAGLKKQSQDYSLFRDWLPFSSLLQVPLNPEDYFLKDISADGSYDITYPSSVTLDFGDGPKLCSRLEFPDDLFIQNPSFLKSNYKTDVSNWVVYDSETLQIDTISFNSKLNVLITDSSEYYVTGKGEFTSGRYFVEIEGYDPFGKEILERITVRDDGLYVTSEIYSEVTKVTSQGFNGRVRLYIGSAKAGIQNPYYLGADQDSVGPMKHEVEVIDGESFLTYSIDRVLLGSSYRRNGEVAELEDNQVWVDNLKDQTGLPIEAVDCCFDWHNGKVVVLDSQGIAHWYDIGRTSFTQMSMFQDLTFESYIEVQPLTHWAYLDQELTMFTRFQRPRIVIGAVSIKRIDPDGNVSYLKSDRTWDSSPNKLSYPIDPSALEPVNSWTDIVFTSYMDKPGEWEFYCECEEYNTKNVTVTGTKVSVPSKNAEVSLDTFVLSSESETPDRIFYDKDGRLCVGTQENSAYHLDSLYYYYYGDVEDQSIWFAPILNIESDFALESVEVLY